ncbi:MAG TPA: aldo/keto reductase [Planctomycetota bacterium]|nr:aldo/keto reductase [Planctomycetota bacterium]
MTRERDGEAREKGLTRREFVRGGGVLVAGALGFAGPLLPHGTSRLAGAEESAGEKPRGGPGAMPRQVLGKTGAEVSILGLGTALLGHQNNNKPEIPKLIGVFSEAVDRGINYVDTARIYGGAEEALRTVLKTRRDKVFLVTKVWANTAAEAEKSFHASLQQLEVEAVDVLHLHSAGDKEIDKVLGPGGSWEFLQKAKKEGKTRFVGITGHSRPANFVRILETGTVDVLMAAMNFVDRHVYGFEEKVLPVARKHKTGVMAMKVYGGVKGGFSNYGSRTPFPSQMKAEHHERSIAYVKSLEGVTGMVIGAHSREQLLENIERVLAAKPLSKEDFVKLCEEGKKLAPEWEARFGPVA